MHWDLILAHLDDSLLHLCCARAAAISEVMTLREYPDCQLAVLHSLGGSHCCEVTAFQTWAFIRASLWMSPEDIQELFPRIKPVCQCERGLIFLQDKITGHEVIVNRRASREHTPRIFASCSGFNVVP